MKTTILLLLLGLSAPFASAQLGSFSQPAQISSTTIFDWDPVTSTTDGEPITISTYTLATFASGSATPLFTVTASTPSGAFGLLITNLTSSVMYETRVKAQATDNLQSPWSSAFYI